MPMATFQCARARVRAMRTRSPALSGLKGAIEPDRCEYPSGLVDSVQELVRETMALSRRQFFAQAAGAVLQPGAGGGKRDMMVRAARPQDLEMPLSGFTDYITPIDRFFVRSHVYTPRVAADGW